eukprot:1501041-Rhodomonas_salina.1
MKKDAAAVLFVPGIRLNAFDFAVERPSRAQCAVGPCCYQEESEEVRPEVMPYAMCGTDIAYAVPHSYAMC